MVFHRRRMLAPIVSVKHYVGQPEVDIALGTSLTLEVAVVVAAPVDTNREKVSEGSMIKAVHFEFWLLAIGAPDSTTQFVLTIEKSPSNAVNPAFSDMLNLGGYANKKNILYTTQGVLASNENGGNSIPMIRDWIKIPKGKQRMGQEDRILVSIATVASPLRICGMSIFKEYQ